MNRNGDRRDRLSDGPKPAKTRQSDPNRDHCQDPLNNRAKTTEPGCFSIIAVKTTSSKLNWGSETPHLRASADDRHRLDRRTIEFAHPRRSKFLSGNDSTFVIYPDG